MATKCQQQCCKCSAPASVSAQGPFHEACGDASVEGQCWFCEACNRVAYREAREWHKEGRPSVWPIVQAQSEHPTQLTLLNH